MFTIAEEKKQNIVFRMKPVLRIKPETPKNDVYVKTSDVRNKAI